MKLAYSKPTRTADDAASLLANFADLGFEGLQLKPNQYRDSLDDGAAFRNATLGVASAVIVFDSLTDGGDLLRRSIEFAAAAGTERVVFCHDSEPTDGSEATLHAYAAMLQPYERLATDRGVSFSLHHHTGEPVMTAEDVRRFFGAEAASHIGLTVDTGHLAKSGVEDIPGFIHEFRDHIDNIHLKDFDGENWVLPGRGTVDLDGVLAALASIDYQGWLCLDEESTTPLAESRQACAEWIRTHLHHANQPVRK